MTAAAAIIATLLPQGAATPGQPAGGEGAQSGFADLLAGLIGQAGPATPNNTAAPQSSLLAPSTGTDGALAADAGIEAADALGADALSAEAASADAAASLLNLMASTAGAQPAPIAPLQITEPASANEAAPRATGAVMSPAPMTSTAAAAGTLLQASLAGANTDGALAADTAPLHGTQAPAQDSAPAPATAPAAAPAPQPASVPAAISAQINALLNEAQAQPQAQPPAQPTATPAPAAKSDGKSAKIETNAAVTRLNGAVVPAGDAAVEVETAEAVTAVTGQANDDPVLEFTAADDKPAPAATSAETPAPMASPIAAAAPILVALGQSVIKATAQTISHFVDQVAAKAGPKNTQFDIALTPEGLGNVDVKLTITPDGALTAALSFDTPQAAAELRARTAELQQALTQAGFDISESAISFDVTGQGQGGGNGEAQANYLESLRERANRAVTDLADEASAALANPPYSRPASGQGVDIRI